ncbi:MAG: sigma-70 family RNA polymerase sigma factor [Chloroflexi bacterium]|nr:sigma-70 family RNA polymerase sigma factor [Chloroflexota bacterium]
MLQALSPESIARAQRGDSAVIGEMYDRYRLGIFRYLYYRTGDLHAAEDLTSEVFLRMLRALEGYRPQSTPFEAWLYQIARNLAIDHYRRTAASPAAPLHEELPAEQETPDGRMERRLTSQLLAQALQGLNETQRDVILLRFVNGLSIAQAARTLHKSEDSVKALQRRGLAALREALAAMEVYDDSFG